MVSQAWRLSSKKRVRLLCLTRVGAAAHLCACDDCTDCYRYRYVEAGGAGTVPERVPDPEAAKKCGSQGIRKKRGSTVTARSNVDSFRMVQNDEKREHSKAWHHEYDRQMLGMREDDGKRRCQDTHSRASGTACTWLV